MEPCRDSQNTKVTKYDDWRTNRVKTDVIQAYSYIHMKAPAELEKRDV